MVNATGPMVHPTGVFLFVITGRVSWGIRSCDPFPQLTQPTGFPCTPTGYFPYRLQIEHQLGLVATCSGSNVLFRKRTTDRVFHKPGQVLISCSSISHPTGTHISALSHVFPTILPAEYICIAGVTNSFHDFVTFC